MTPTTSEEVKKLLFPFDYVEAKKLLVALETDKLAEPRRRKLRLLAA